VTALRLWLVRHGETAWSLNGQHTGTSDIALTAHGEAQARALAPALGAMQFAHVFTSPARRARQTCALAGFAGAAAADADLAEWDYGDDEGLRTGEIRAQRPGWTIRRDGCPGGESPDAVAHRADRAIAALRELSGDVLLFSHCQFGCSLSARWIGLGVIAAQHLQLDTAAIGVLGCNPAHAEIAVIARWNWAPDRAASAP